MKDADLSNFDSSNNWNFIRCSYMPEKDFRCELPSDHPGYVVNCQGNSPFNSQDCDVSCDTSSGYETMNLLPPTAACENNESTLVFSGCTQTNNLNSITSSNLQDKRKKDHHNYSSLIRKYLQRYFVCLTFEKH